MKPFASRAAAFSFKASSMAFGSGSALSGTNSAGLDAKVSWPLAFVVTVIGAKEELVNVCPATVYLYFVSTTPPLIRKPGGRLVKAKLPVTRVVGSAVNFHARMSCSYQPAPVAPVQPTKAFVPRRTDGRLTLPAGVGGSGRTGISERRTSRSCETPS